MSGLWCEDWVGLRHTSFGARLFWDWKANDDRYPGLRQRIAELEDRGIRFLGYVNPYLAVDGSLFPEAEAAGYFATDESGKTALVDFGEFDCGVVDFTNPDAAAWFAERVIGQNMLDFGLSGWMADFGEYLPIDVKLANGVDAKLMHNAWPTLWAEVNARAVESRGKTGEALFFMRAGFTGVQKHCPLLWGGDQSVDFTRHDGLVTVISGALSSGLLGNAYHHSDIGGYTSLFGNVRTAELIMRWAEMGAFTPVMRTHEGNRPRDNLQIDQDPQVLAHFARMTQGLCAPRALSEIPRGGGFRPRAPGAAAPVPPFRGRCPHLCDPGCLSLRPRPARRSCLAGREDRMDDLSSGRCGLDPCVVRPRHSRAGARQRFLRPSASRRSSIAPDSEFAELFAGLRNL